MSLHHFATAYVIGQTAARNYDRMLSRGTSPDIAAKAVFEDHFEAELQTTSPRTDAAHSPIVRTQPA